jgi:small-conductance mechanosensitive channel
MELLDRVLYDNTVRQWLVAAGIAVLSFFVLRVIVAVVRGRLKRLASLTTTQWDDLVIQVLSRTRGLTLTVVSLYLGASTLALPVRLMTAIRAVTILSLLFQAGTWVTAGVTAWLDRYTQKELVTDRGAATTMRAMGFVAQLVIWVVLLMVALDNLGIDITTLIAGLGVGGIAVALATQNILGDLFASLSIVLDKPFVLGDFVIVDNLMGTVEHIGLKTTRLRSLWGEQVVFSNADLLKSRLRNFGRMQERRIVFRIGVTYQTPRAVVERIPGILREAITSQEKVRFDRAHFAGFGDSSLDFEAVYFMLVPDYLPYMDTQQAINLKIMERFEEEGVEFAYPTRTVFLARESREADEVVV